MKILSYKKVDERIELETIHHEAFIDENGKFIPPCDEVIKKVIPIMGVVYEDMTSDDIEAQQKVEDIPVVQTPEERINELENQVKALTETIATLTKN